MHARALKGAALSARRIDELEARMLDLEEDLHELVTRAKKSDPYVCPVCDATFKSARELTVCCAPFCVVIGADNITFLSSFFYFAQSHKDLNKHHRKIAPAPARRN